MNNIELFHSLVHLAAVDNKFTDEEIQFLVQRAERWNIPSEEFEAALAGISAGEFAVKIPETLTDRVTMLKEMIRLMAIDGVMAEPEKRLCAVASGRMEFTSKQFSQILDEVIAEA
ncbi:MAG: tellurite resistance TerB family protein [Pirellulales bacterium]